MKLQNLIVLFVALATLTACGGSDSPPESPKGLGYKKTGPFDSDGARPTSFSALYGTEVADSVCLPDVPELADFNNWADRQAEQGNTGNRKYITSNLGGVESSIQLVRQNKEMLEGLGALVFEFKDQNPYGGKMSARTDKLIYRDIPPNCQSIACVGESVFSRTYGARLYAKKQFGFLLSEHLDEGQLSDFKNENNLESVMFAIGTLPKSAVPLKAEEFYTTFKGFANNVILSPYNRGEMLNAGGARTAAETYVSTINRTFYADVNIYLYDLWQDSPDFYERVYILYHEFMHVYDKVGFHSESDEFKKISDWKVEGGYWKMGDTSKSCSYYGESSPHEDFAECGALYRFAPLRLLAISPEKYEFFKTKIFQGLEYDATSACADQVIKFTGI